MQYHTESSSSSSSSSDRAWDYYYAPPTGPIRTLHDDPLERVAHVASRSAVVIFSISTCCMCHAAKQLFSSLGVSPTVHELDRDPFGEEMERVLMRLVVGSSSRAAVVPVVFIGGKLVGSMDRVMASHISGSLVPLLKEAGALWL